MLMVVEFAYDIRDVRARLCDCFVCVRVRVRVRMYVGTIVCVPVCIRDNVSIATIFSTLIKSCSRNVYIPLPLIA